jgi:YjjG family noncanonical pyrimidine nucleotidase
MFQHILFDADNTLFDFDQMERGAFLRTMQAFDVPCDDALFSRYREMNRQLWLVLEQGKADRAFELVHRFRRLLPDHDFSAEEMNKAYQRHLVEQMVPMEGALAVCEQLCKVAALSIVTNGVGPTQRGKLKRSPLEPYFPRQFISEEVGFSKPDIRFFEHVMAALDYPDPSRVLIVGDSLTSDIQGGMNAGIVTCWLNRDGVPLPEGYRADYIIGGLHELLDIVLEGR